MDGHGNRVSDRTVTIEKGFVFVSAKNDRVS
jgi:hypothetical protein